VTTTILAAFPSPSQGVWHLGPLPIRAYALFIILGIIAALVVGDRRWVARGGEAGVIYDVALWAVPFGLIGGRLYHLATDWRTYWGPDGAGFGAALRIWDGGLGIWGAVALGGVGAWIACRRRGIPLPAFGDAIAPGIVLAQAIGRIGNYFNQELYGRETTVPWGLEIFYRRDTSGIVDVHSLNGVSTGEVAAVVHPTFLYELLWNLLVFAVLILVDRRFKMGHGRLFALYVAGYCMGRFWVELLRDDTATHIDGIRINSFTSTFVFIGAVVYIILAPKGREAPSALRGNTPLETDDESEVEQVLAKELAAVAGTTGVVAAATVAGREEAAPEHSSGAGDKPADAESQDTEPTDADDIAGDAEDEAILEAEVTAPSVEVESVVDAEDDVIDEDHDPIDEDELEALTEAGGGAVSEQAETLETDSEADAEFGTDEPESETLAEPTDADDVAGDAEDEAQRETEVAAPSVEVESVVDAEDDVIDDDHDPIDEDELETLTEVSAATPVSEQAESLEPKSAADAEFTPDEPSEANADLDELEGGPVVPGDPDAVATESGTDVAEAVEASEEAEEEEQAAAEVSGHEPPAAEPEPEPELAAEPEPEPEPAPPAAEPPAVSQAAGAPKQRSLLRRILFGVQ